MAIERISIDNFGKESNASSSSPAISNDGRFVVFASDAANLVPNDTNDVQDIFLYDRSNNMIELVSVGNSGLFPNDASQNPAISEDGRFITFESLADNLVANDSNGASDIFVYDRTTKTTERVSVNNAGEEGIISTYLYYPRAYIANSYTPSISSDGRFVAFESWANNFVSSDMNDATDIFVFDRETKTIERVSVSSLNLEGNGDSFSTSISGDGRFISFHSGSDNFVANDTNNVTDVFVHDRLNKTTERVSVSNSGIEGNQDSNYASISNDGRFVAFTSSSFNLVSPSTNSFSKIFVYDRTSKTIENVSVSNSGTEANSYSSNASISGDGRFVAFSSSATNLVPGKTNNTTDIFVYDRQQDTIERISTSQSGLEGNEDSNDSAISNNGQFITFVSAANNLIFGDTNDVKDIFVASRLKSQEFSNVCITETGGSTTIFENYGADTYQIFLTVKPIDNVKISLSTDPGLTVTPPELIFTPENFQTVQTVTVTGKSDGKVGDRSATILHKLSSLDINYESLTIPALPVSLIDIDNIHEISSQARFLPRSLSERTDIITASSEGSFLLGKNGNDVLLGHSGFDRFSGQDGSDYLSGAGNSDYLNGQVGNDLLDGGDGDDVLYGGNDRDSLNGDRGNDLLIGEEGDDQLFGGDGDDLLTGGFGADIFILGKNPGVDTFQDFQPGLDRLNLIDGLVFTDLKIEPISNTIGSRILNKTGQVLVLLPNTPANLITSENFF